MLQMVVAKMKTDPEVRVLYLLLNWCTVNKRCQDYSYLGLFVP